MAEMTKEELDRLIGEGVEKALKAREKKVLTVTPEVTDEEIAKAAAAAEAAEKKVYECAKEGCDHKADAPFSPCPKCGTEQTWD